MGSKDDSHIVDVLTKPAGRGRCEIIRADFIVDKINYCKHDRIKESEEDNSDDDMEQEDEGTISRQVETDLEPSREYSSLASSATTYSDDPE